MSHLTVLLLVQEGETTAIGSLYQLILDGGWMMVPIGLCSVVALAFIVERSSGLRRARLIPRSFASGIEGVVDQGTAPALEYCARNKSPIARMFEAGLRRWDHSRPDLEKAVEDAGTREMARMGGNLRALVVVATVSPLLGLLGTVMGMIKAFQVIALEGTGKPELLADGISQALVTTAAGLIVAIPTQVAYFWLRAKIDWFAREAESLYASILGRRHDQKKAA